MYLSIDAVMGCIRKQSAGRSSKEPNHSETMFINQETVDSFLKNYSSEGPSSQEVNLVLYTANI